MWRFFLSIDKLIPLSLILKGPIKEVLFGLLLRPNGIAAITSLLTRRRRPSLGLTAVPSTCLIPGFLGFKGAGVKSAIPFSAAFVLSVVAQDPGFSAEGVRVPEFFVLGPVVYAEFNLMGFWLAFMLSQSAAHFVPSSPAAGPTFRPQSVL